MNIDARLNELGIVLPSSVAPLANYVPALQVGNLLFLSGHLAKGGADVHTGKLGKELTEDDGYLAARSAAIDVLASAKNALGSLDRIRRIVKVTGMVNCTEKFTQQSAVINGASDLFVEVFGDAGRHARAAFGVIQLPFGAAVEVEAIFEVETA